MTEVIMPKMGDGMEEGTLVEWLKKDGDTVKSGEVIGNIQTDKATLELEAPGTGVFTGILIQAGESVPVGRPIAAILKAGESLPENWGGAPTPSEVPAVAKPVAAPAEEPAIAVSNGAASSPAPAPTSTERVKASPLAKKIAAELGVDLAAVSGSGPGGRIVEKDVRRATPATSVAASAATKTATPLPTVFATAEDTKIPLNKIRQITAKRTQESKQQAPHFYVTVEVDVEKILALRTQMESEESGKVSINDFVVKACAFALRELPQVNSSYQGDHLIQYGAVNIGIAVALEDGLTVPVVQNADQLTLRQISSGVKILAKKAKENKLGMDELTGSTFAISNMGMLDVDTFGAIVNLPNAAIIAIASIKKAVKVNQDDEVEIRSVMNITGSFDHRVCDGAVGAKFVNIVRTYLQNPTRLIS